MKCCTSEYNCFSNYTHQAILLISLVLRDFIDFVCFQISMVFFESRYRFRYLANSQIGPLRSVDSNFCRNITNTFDHTRVFQTVCPSLFLSRIVRTIVRTDGLCWFSEHYMNTSKLNLEHFRIHASSMDEIKDFRMRASALHATVRIYNFGNRFPQLLWFVLSSLYGNGW